MSAYRFLNWPFLEDEVVSIYWITSPIAVPSTGAKQCIVYFQRMPGEEPEPILAPWGMMPDLWIGRRFQNGMPVDVPEAAKETIDIQISRIKDPEIVRAATAIPTSLYSLFKKSDLCAEYCVRFWYDRKQYVVPCMELARAFYMENSLLSNQLLTEGGLENLIELSSWQVKGKNLEFDFSRLCHEHLSKHFASTVATLCGIAELRDGWKQTYTGYVRERKISTGIPSIPGLKLQCIGIEGNGATVLTEVELAPFSPPFDSIQYGPDQLKNTGKGKNSKGKFHTEKDPETVEIGDPSSAGKNGPATSISGGHRGMRFSGPITVTRRQSKSSDEGGIRPMEGKAVTSVFTPNDRTGKGTLPFLNIEPTTEEKIAWDPDFSDFCNALRYLTAFPTVSKVEVSYGILPGEKSFSYLHGKSHRKFAFAEVVIASKTWVIIELCLKDGYSLSTLFIQHSGNAKELANQMIGKLLTANGHWSQDCFEPGLVCRTLDHHKGRTSRRWAELMRDRMV